MLTNEEFAALARDVLLASIKKKGLLPEEVQARAAVRMVAAFDAALDGEMKRRSFARSGLTPEEIELIRAHKKIDAIKMIRDRTGLSLKESKDLVDRYVDMHDIQ